MAEQCQHKFAFLIPGVCWHKRVHRFRRESLLHRVRLDCKYVRPFRGRAHQKIGLEPGLVIDMPLIMNTYSGFLAAAPSLECQSHRANIIV